MFLFLFVRAALSVSLAFRKFVCCLEWCFGAHYHRIFLYCWFQYVISFFNSKRKKLCCIAMSLQDFFCGIKMFVQYKPDVAVARWKTLANFARNLVSHQNEHAKFFFLTALWALGKLSFPKTNVVFVVCTIPNIFIFFIDCIDFFKYPNAGKRKNGL